MVLWEVTEEAVATSDRMWQPGSLKELRSMVDRLECPDSEVSGEEVAQVLRRKAGEKGLLGFCVQ